MFSPRWQKILRDLWSNKTRTVLVILSIAVGVFSVGMIVSSRLILLKDLSAIFAETMHSSRVIEQLAREAQVTLPPPLYTDALGTKGSAGETYIQMMRYNVDTIVNALQPQSS